MDDAWRYVIASKRHAGRIRGVLQVYRSQPESANCLAEIGSIALVKAITVSRHSPRMPPKFGLKTKSIARVLWLKSTTRRTTETSPILQMRGSVSSISQLSQVLWGCWGSAWRLRGAGCCWDEYFSGISLVTCNGHRAQVVLHLKFADEMMSDQCAFTGARG